MELELSNGLMEGDMKGVLFYFFIVQTSSNIIGKQQLINYKLWYYYRNWENGKQHG